MRVILSVPGFRCERCTHEWVPFDIEVEPRVCPRCKSPYWNQPRRFMSRKAIREGLDQARGFDGGSPTKKDRKTIEELLTKERKKASKRQADKKRKRAK